MNIHSFKQLILIYIRHWPFSYKAHRNYCRRLGRGLPADYAADYPRTTRGLCRGLCRRLPADTDYAADCAAHFAGAPPKPKAKQNSQNTLAATIVVPGPSLLPVLMKKD